MECIFFISNIIILVFTFFLQIWGICCILIFRNIIRSLDKILFFMPICIPVKTIERNIEGTDNTQGLIVFLKVVGVYKIVFLINIILCIFFLLYKK